MKNKVIVYLVSCTVDVGYNVLDFRSRNALYGLDEYERALDVEGWRNAFVVVMNCSLL